MSKAKSLFRLPSVHTYCVLDIIKRKTQGTYVYVCACAHLCDWERARARVRACALVFLIMLNKDYFRFHERGGKLCFGWTVDKNVCSNYILKKVIPVVRSLTCTVDDRTAPDWSYLLKNVFICIKRAMGKCSMHTEANPDVILWEKKTLIIILLYFIFWWFGRQILSDFRSCFHG